MQSFTKIEISWIAVEFERMSKEYEKSSLLAANQPLARIQKMRAEQYLDISKRLRKALKQGSKRLEIK